MHETRQNYYFPSTASLIRNWVRECERCIKDKRVDNTRTTSEQIHIPEWDFGPEHLLQKRPNTGTAAKFRVPQKCYDNRCNFRTRSFAYLASNPTAVKTAKAMVDIMTRHAFLPTLNIVTKGTLLVSQVIFVVTEKLGFNLKHATTKHAQTIGLLERAHAKN